MDLVVRIVDAVEHIADNPRIFDNGRESPYLRWPTGQTF